MTDPPKLVGTLSGPDGGGVRIVDGDRTFTLAEVRAEVARTRAELRDRGLEAGDRVLALLDHDPEAAFLYAAASALGLRLMMPYGLQAAALPEWLSIAAAARPDAVVHQKRDRTGLDALRQQCDRVVELPHHDEPAHPADPAGEIPIDHPGPIEGFLVLFSSGTTGAPKAISIAESLVVRKIGSITGRLGFGPESRIFMSGLMNNTTGVIFTFGGLVRGATVVFPQDHRPASWPAQVATHGATHVQLRPVALGEFVAAAAVDGVDLSCLEVMAYGGGSVPRALLERGRELIAAAEWVQGYGLSETYGPFSWLGEQAHVEQRYRKYVYDVGRPDDTVEVRLDPVAGHPDGVGEVLVRGAVMEGYLDIATGEVRSPGDWFRTGDLAEWSPDGDLVLKGRMAGALLTRNGHRIYPEEIEAVLADVPGADDVLLVGIAEDGAVGAERPVACLQGPIGDSDPAEVRSVVAGVLERSLSPEKWPDRLLVRTEPFPRSANGKTMRGAVAELIEPSSLIELVP